MVGGGYGNGHPNLDARLNSCYNFQIALFRFRIFMWIHKKHDHLQINKGQTKEKPVLACASELFTAVGISGTELFNQS